MKSDLMQRGEIYKPLIAFLVSVLLILGATIGTQMLNRQDKQGEKIDAIEKDVSNISKDVAVIRAQMDFLVKPSPKVAEKK